MVAHWIIQFVSSVFFIVQLLVGYLIYIQMPILNILRKLVWYCDSLALQQVDVVDKFTSILWYRIPKIQNVIHAIHINSMHNWLFQTNVKSTNKQSNSSHHASDTHAHTHRHEYILYTFVNCLFAFSIQSKCSGYSRQCQPENTIVRKYFKSIIETYAESENLNAASRMYRLRRRRRRQKNVDYE